MTTLFPGATRIEAWLKATAHLAASGPDINVILSISSPASDGPAARAAHRLINDFYSSEEQPSLHTIAETIFPGWEYRRRGLRGVFEIYAEEFEIFKKRDPQRWGTYAYRLVRRRTGDGTVVNPLDVMIKKMQNELQHDRGGAKRACYEIGVAEGEYDLPLYNTVDDQKRRLGLPCLAHLSFKLFDGRLHLAAMYRSHDYRYKVLGNLLGLARLQACVAHEVGVEIGTLVVHSTYAWIDAGGSKRALTRLVTELTNLVATKEAR